MKSHKFVRVRVLYDWVPPVAMQVLACNTYNLFTHILEAITIAHLIALLSHMTPCCV